VGSGAGVRAGGFAGLRICPTAPSIVRVMRREYCSTSEGPVVEEPAHVGLVGLVELAQVAEEDDLQRHHVLDGLPDAAPWLGEEQVVEDGQ
jgi:hypothetical protein